MKTFFRTAFVLLFAIFWGGLTAYTGFVVRISHNVLSDTMEGGLVTQQVTSVLQWLGASFAIAMFSNAIAVRKPCPRRATALTILAGIFTTSIVGLFVVHSQLDAVISIESSEILDRDAFTIGHRRYNQLTTIEWLSSLAYLPLALSTWTKTDRQQIVARRPPPEANTQSSVETTELQ